MTGAATKKHMVLSDNNEKSQAKNDNMEILAEDNKTQNRKR